MRAGPGQTVAGRYLVTDRPEPADPLGTRRLAVDGRTGTRVQLEALELPELLVPELAGSADFESSRWLDPAGVLAEVATVIADSPPHARLRQSFDVAAEAGLIWVVEEEPTDSALPALLADGPLPPYRAAEVAADLARALQAVHAGGRAHGNLVARQVTLGEDGAALLGGQAIGAAEEALARVLGGADGRRWAQARAGLVGACAERWPPELLAEAGEGGGAGARPAPAFGPAGDSWALGVLLQRMLTGQGPFPEQSPIALFAAVRAARRTGAEGCGVLRPLVERLLAPAPADRPTAAEARGWLGGLLVGVPEPYRAAPAEPAVLPVLRPSWPLVRRPRGERAAPVTEHARHARTRGGGRRATLLPVLLVGGVLGAMVLAMAAVVLLAG
ncbi:hypothetical protein GCM10009665_74310 [Kitasatospora nipponensis]|uniref:non-specific serine/threonine protein kinase n=1 Tax=Kitasatospora nipponensis TaxID=258049 RepID=A0ABN1T798_9ACTN